MEFTAARTIELVLTTHTGRRVAELVVYDAANLALAAAQRAKVLDLVAITIVTFGFQLNPIAPQYPQRTSILPRYPSRDRRGGPSFRCEPSACDSHLELAEHRDIRRPPPALLVSGRSLYHELVNSLASWPVAPFAERSLHRERLDPLASWPDAPYPSVFSDPSSPPARVSVLPPLASTEIGIVQKSGFRNPWNGLNSGSTQSGTKKGDTTHTPESCPFYLIRLLAAGGAISGAIRVLKIAPGEIAPRQKETCNRPMRPGRYFPLYVNRRRRAGPTVLAPEIAPGGRVLNRPDIAPEIERDRANLSLAPERGWIAPPLHASAALKIASGAKKKDLAPEIAPRLQAVLGLNRVRSQHFCQSVFGGSVKLGPHVSSYSAILRLACSCCLQESVCQPQNPRVGWVGNFEVTKALVGPLSADRVAVEEHHEHIWPPQLPSQYPNIHLRFRRSSSLADPKSNAFMLPWTPSRSVDPLPYVCPPFLYP
ncbi:hypothetical protein THAOC_19477 [Thalassiosira oceanica]|uniref:Uncharacterized protein n=1 Tax=Thalassiosira oceanica TaxID=159749 RepID=K0SPA1_THAOC|nr:hypothetical protein THAOC_19477 [Thalassiosira oceanica]|eukprot:EJK60222.1 hypothetical protein THAOC_19477 [Thalassiosira oceanica]